MDLKLKGKVAMVAASSKGLCYLKKIGNIYRQHGTPLIKELSGGYDTNICNIMISNPALFLHGTCTIYQPYLLGI